MSSKFPSIVLILGLAGLAGCAPTVLPAGPDIRRPAMTTSRLVMPDGTALPLQIWLPKGKPRAVILGIHGMNDYANAFTLSARHWRKQGIATYAYDQRGFGRTKGRGLWPGTRRLQRDFIAAVAAIRSRHPRTPIFAVGLSMGGGVVLSTMGRPDAPQLDGVVLVAPAVWNRAAMPPLYSATLWLAAHTVPAFKLTGSGLKRLASDNIPMLRAFSKDKHVIRGTRVDAIYGLVNLMDAAAAAAPRIKAPVLLIYGERDEIIPRPPIQAVLKRLPSRGLRVGLYADGWHMLLRDKKRKVVQDDIITWMTNRGRPLPSGADKKNVEVVLNQKRPTRPKNLR